MTDVKSEELDRLEPCPWCGSEPVTVSEDDWTSVMCGNTQCLIASEVSLAGGDHRNRAVAAWNRRLIAQARRDGGEGEAQVQLVAKIIRMHVDVPGPSRAIAGIEEAAHAILAALRQPDTARDDENRIKGEYAEDGIDEIAGLEVTEAICRDRIQRKVAASALNACMASGEGEPEIGDAFHFFGFRADAGFTPVTLIWKDEAGYLYQKDDGTRVWAPSRPDYDILVVSRALRTPADPRPDPRDEALKEAREVWVVGASCGEYSDRREWNVSAHLSEQEAKDEVGRLTVLARELAAREPDTDDSTWEDECPIYQAYQAWQKEVDETIGGSDPEDTRFFAGPVPLAKIDAVIGGEG